MTDHQLAQVVWDYMRYETPLEKADIILGLGSDDIRIAEHAAALYLQGYAPKILFSGGNIQVGTYKYFSESEAETFRKRAIELGVPKEDILIEPEATNTGQNITKSYEVMVNNDIYPSKIILVQKPFMLRRTYATFMKQWPGERVPEIVTSAINLSMEEYVKDARYNFEHTVNIMLGDLQRIREYPKLGYQTEQDIPDEVWKSYQKLTRRGYDKNLIKKGV